MTISCFEKKPIIAKIIYFIIMLRVVYKLQFTSPFFFFDESINEIICTDLNSDGLLGFDNVLIITIH